jgi:hypothetical protein
MHKAFVILLFVFINQSCFSQQIKRFLQLQGDSSVRNCTIEQYYTIDKQIEFALDSMERLIPVNYHYLFNPYCYYVEFDKRGVKFTIVVKRISTRSGYDVNSFEEWYVHMGYAKWRNAIVFFGSEKRNVKVPRNCCNNIIKELMYYHLPEQEQHEIDIDYEIHFVGTAKNSIRTFPIDITKE